MKKRITCKDINAEIAKLGGKERLVAGKDYWYFIEGDSEKWVRSSVMIYRLNALTLKQWVEIWRDYRDEFLNS